MGFNPLQAEQTAAITDAILALAALAAALHLLRFRGTDPWKSGLWAAVMLSILLATALGTLAHGLLLSAASHARVWMVIHLVLWVATALLATGTLYDLRGAETVRRILPVALLLAVIAFGLTRPYGESLAALSASQTVILSSAIAAYVHLARTRGLAGAPLMALGAGIAMLAGVLRAMGLGAFELIWRFDANGTCHLIQLVALVLLTLGQRAGLRPGARSAADRRNPREARRHEARTDARTPDLLDELPLARRQPPSRQVLDG